MSDIDFIHLPEGISVDYNRPIYMSNCLTTSALVQNLNLEYLNNLCPTQEVSVSYYDCENSAMNLIQSFSNTELLTITEIYKQNGENQFEKKAVEECPDTIRNNSILLNYVSKVSNQLNNPTLWINGKDRVIDFHKDAHDAILIQVEGKKIIRFVSSEFDSEMKIVGAEKINALFKFLKDANNARSYGDDTTWSERYAFKKNLNLNSKITGFEIEISPGDIVFIPKTWWHATKSLDLNLSINCEVELCNLNLESIGEEK